MTENLHLQKRLLAPNLYSMKEHGKTFYWSLRFLPLNLQSDVKTIYGFCRLVDNAVDLCQDSELAQIEMNRIRNIVLSKEQMAEPEILDYLELCNRRKIDLSLALELIDGVSSDIYFNQMPDMFSLLEYSRKVAGTVGQMLCSVFGCTESESLSYARDLGMAMQLTNIARDVEEDFASDRIYIPADLISQSEVAQALMHACPRSKKRLIEAITQVLDQSAQLYRSADLGIRYLPLNCRVSILTASRAYEKIGKIIRQDFDKSLRSRIRTNNLQKLLCCFTALSSVIFDPKYHSTRHL